MNADRETYLAAFLSAARQEVPIDLARWHATLETLEATDGPGDEAYAVATVALSTSRYTYRRRVWPPSHPATTQAGIFATTLVERLLTAAATSGPTTVVQRRSRSV